MLTNTDLYNEDFVAWCDTTAALLRAGQWDGIDTEVLAEEIESLAKRDSRELESRLEGLVMHLLKWQYQPWRRAEGHSWASTILEHRSRLARLLRDSPSLRPQVARLLEESYPVARQRAIVEMTPGWPTRPDPGFLRQPGMEPVIMSLDVVLPQVCPWRAEEVLDLDFWPPAFP